MKKHEPYMGTENEKEPSWMSFKTKKQLTQWQITWAVCAGILLASAIEKLTDLLMLWAYIHVDLEPAIKQLIQGHH